ncbi:MAG: alpha/beta hydrolase [Pseudomonadota bacterium]
MRGSDRCRHTARRVVILFAIALGAAGCSGIDALNALTPRSGYAVHRDLLFDAGTGLRLDVYVPSGARNAPVAVFFYGGSWQKGARADYRFVGEALARQGVVVAIPDYRLYPAVRYPAFLSDAARAVAWMHAHAARYGGDPHMLFLAGHSAGAYNAAMLSLNPEYLAVAGMDRDTIRGMIGLAGPYDFLPLRDAALKEIFAPAGDLRESQPVAHVDGHNPPLLLIHGRDDRQVRVDNSRRLAARVEEAGGPVTLHLYDHLSHALAVANLAAPLRWRSDLLQQIGDFIRAEAAVPPSTARSDAETPVRNPVVQHVDAQ